MAENKKSRKLVSWIIRFIKGALIGVGAILPGISGGVLCVVFGFYRPLMEFLSNPIRGIKTKFWFFLPVVLGGLTGMLGLARLVELMFEKTPYPAVWLFIGLVVGTLPSLFREAGQKGRGRTGWIWLAVGFFMTILWMYALKSTVSITVTPSLAWWIICGLLWGVGFIVPGMSPSSFFIYLGLYQPMTKGIADLNMGVILPILLGALVSVVLFARAMRFLINNAYPSVFHAIFGIVTASTIAIIPTDAPYGTFDIAIYLGCFLAGGAFAYFMERLSDKLSSSASFEENKTGATSEKQENQ